MLNDYVVKIAFKAKELTVEDIEEIYGDINHPSELSADIIELIGFSGSEFLQEMLKDVLDYALEELDEQGYDTSRWKDIILYDEDKLEIVEVYLDHTTEE